MIIFKSVIGHRSENVNLHLRQTEASGFGSALSKLATFLATFIFMRASFSMAAENAPKTPVKTPTRTVLVHGHRGARARFPENTLPAFEYAVKLGVDFLEMDMAVTKDRHILISHDPHISKVICLDPQGKPIVDEPLIFSLTLAEAQKYDCGSIRNPKFDTQTPVPHTKRPTLDEVFTMVEKLRDPHAKTVKFNIETKIYADHPEYTVDPQEFVKLFYATVKKHHMQKRVVLQSFDFRTLAEMRKVDPKIPISALVEIPDDKSKKPLDLIAVAEETKADISSPQADMLTPEIVAKLHKLKESVHPWTVNKPDQWQKLVDINVDGIISDDPEPLLKYLRDKGLHP